MILNIVFEVFFIYQIFKYYFSFSFIKCLCCCVVGFESSSFSSFEEDFEEEGEEDSKEEEWLELLFLEFVIQQYEYLIKLDEK